MASLTREDATRRSDAADVRASVAGAGWFWPTGALAIAVLVSVPTVAITVMALFPTENVWGHLASTVLPVYIASTVSLMVLVGIGVLVLGTTTAWLVAMCRFPGRKVFQWALFLPLAMPAYVIAYTYTDLLEYAGPVQGMLREMFGWKIKADYWFPEIRSLGGAAAMLILVLYPYVYAMARAAFLEQSVCVLEASRVLGRTPWRAFREVALPLARPAIVVGTTLALMETLNDFGTVDFFAVQTLTAGVFDVWFGMGNPGGAAQIALVMLGFVVLLLWFERSSRARQRFHHTTTRIRHLPGHELAGWRRVGAMLVCGLPVLLGFLVPASVLAGYALDNFDQQLSGDYAKLVANSLGLAGVAAIAAVSLAAFLAYAIRLRPVPVVRAIVRLATIGYAIPGAVLAIGVMLPTAGVDNWLDGLMRQWFGVSTGLLFSGTVFILVVAYTVRFLAMSFGAIESGLSKVTANMDMAARTLGHGPTATLARVHLPLIRGSALTGGVLVFVDTMKELPATLVLRPFNFDTLATYVYQFASDELLEECALAALTIVAAGILPVILLSRAISTARPSGEGQ
ncbi:MAG: iron ABC transporter permease [Rhodospirillaceae bacterium]|nr:iron ABC transporter permease [Rhodospirillaceae bacterium]